MLGDLSHHLLEEVTAVFESVLSRLDYSEAEKLAVETTHSDNAGHGG